MPELRPFAALRIAHRQRVRDVLASAWPDRGSQQQFLIAALAHTVDFFTWRSLRRQGLTNEGAIELIVGPRPRNLIGVALGPLRIIFNRIGLSALSLVYPSRDHGADIPVRQLRANSRRSSIFRRLAVIPAVALSHESIGATCPALFGHRQDRRFRIWCRMRR